MCEKQDICSYAVAEMAKFGVFSHRNIVKNSIFGEK
jgi:hypothetical protein